MIQTVQNLFKVLILSSIFLLAVQWYMYKSEPTERPTPLDTGSSIHSTLWTKKVQLCVMFNLHHMAPNVMAINLLLSYYSYFFSHIMVLFDGKWKKPNYLPKNVTFSGCISGAGLFEHKCLHICLNEKWRDSRPEGYLFIADDMFINIVMMSSLPLSQIWYLGAVNINYTARASLRNHWHWNKALKPLEVVIQHLPAKWKDVLVKKFGFPNRMPATARADIVYVPYSLAGTMMDVLTFITRTAKLIMEVAVPLTVNIVAPTDQVHFRDGYLKGKKITMSIVENQARKAHFVHPIKLSREPQARLWKTLMEEQLRNLSAL